MSRREPIALVILVLTTLGLLVVLWPKSDPALEPDEAAIRDATMGAIRTLVTDVIPPLPYRGGPIPSPLVQEMKARLATDIARYFTGPLQRRYEPMIESGINSLGPTDWDRDGGIEVIHWSTPVMTDGRGMVRAGVREWLVHREGPSGTRPVRTHRLDSAWNWDVTLVRVTGQWRVDALDTQCVSGCP